MTTVQHLEHLKEIGNKEMFYIRKVERSFFRWIYEQVIPGIYPEPQIFYFYRLFSGLDPVRAEKIFFLSIKTLYEEGKREYGDYKRILNRHFSFPQFRYYFFYILKKSWGEDISEEILFLYETEPEFLSF